MRTLSSPQPVTAAPITVPILELEQRVRASWTSIRDARDLTEERLVKLRRSLAGIATDDDLAVVLYGSVARREVTPGSDVDWTLLVDGSASTDHFETAREIERKLTDGKFKPPAQEGAFGAMAFSHELVHPIGGQDDTNRNTTRRVLLLLESTPLTESAAHRNVVRNVLRRYLLEDDGFVRERSGRHLVPRFLLNDVARYWRTMCVDFANKRRMRHKKGMVLRNIKLRMSRKLLFASGLLTCFCCELNTAHPEGFGCAKHCSHGHVGCVDCLQQFIRQPALDILAMTALRLDAVSSGKTVAAAKRIVDAYNEFLAVLANKEKRDRLDQLTDFENSPDFEEARKISHDFSDGLHELFFEAHGPLRDLTQLYGVF